MIEINVRRIKAFSIIELLVALTIFLIISIPVRSVVTLGYRNISYDNSYLNAVFYAKEGIEAARFIRAASWNSLNPGTYGIRLDDNAGWQLIENPQSENGFMRSIVVSNVYRDASGNIVDDDSQTLDQNTKKVESIVNWNWLSVQSKSISLIAYLTHVN